MWLSRKMETKAGKKASQPIKGGDVAGPAIDRTKMLTSVQRGYKLNFILKLIYWVFLHPNWLNEVHS